MIKRQTPTKASNGHSTTFRNFEICFRFFQSTKYYDIFFSIFNPHRSKLLCTLLTASREYQYELKVTMISSTFTRQCKIPSFKTKMYKKVPFLSSQITNYLILERDRSAHVNNKVLSFPFPLLNHKSS